MGSWAEGLTVDSGVPYWASLRTTATYEKPARTKRPLFLGEKVGVRETAST